MGEDGHPGTLSFVQGSSIHILPPLNARKEDLMLVTFTSFNEQGMLRYRTSNDQHKEILPGNIGNRAITAQLLAAGLASQEAVSDQEQVRHSKRQKPHRHIRQSSPEPAAQEEAARKKQRKEKDDAHRQACTVLEANPHWADVEQEQVTREKDGRSMTFQTLKLSEAACCKEFGTDCCRVSHLRAALLAIG